MPRRIISSLSIFLIVALAASIFPKPNTALAISLYSSDENSASPSAQINDPSGYISYFIINQNNSSIYGDYRNTAGNYWPGKDIGGGFLRESGTSDFPYPASVVAPDRVAASEKIFQSAFAFNPPKDLSGLVEYYVGGSTNALAQVYTQPAYPYMTDLSQTTQVRYLNPQQVEFSVTTSGSYENIVPSARRLNIGFSISGNYVAQYSDPRYGFAAPRCYDDPSSCTSPYKLFTYSIGDEIGSYSYSLCQPYENSEDAYKPAQICFTPVVWYQNGRTYVAYPPFGGTDGAEYWYYNPTSNWGEPATSISKISGSVDPQTTSTVRSLNSDIVWMRPPKCEYNSSDGFFSSSVSVDCRTYAMSADGRVGTAAYSDRKSGCGFFCDILGGVLFVGSFVAPFTITDVIIPSELLDITTGNIGGALLGQIGSYTASLSSYQVVNSVVGPTAYGTVENPANGVNLGSWTWSEGFNAATLPTSTSAATTTPPAKPTLEQFLLPTCAFSPSPSSIIPPQTTSLQWTCNNANSCSINQGIGSVGVSGSKTVAPKETTTYTLSCANGFGNAAYQATVTVKKTNIKEVAP